MQIIDVFSGIGGFSEAGKWMGWETIQLCEIDTFCGYVLESIHPGVPIHKDIKTLDYDEINRRIDRSRGTILVGGIPCQPYSVAGKQLGTEDDRHLWPYMLKAVKRLRPTYVVGENVRGLVSWNGGVVFDQVQTDLENEGYEVFPVLLPAAGVNAPHRRDRIWFIAYAEGNRNRGEIRELEKENGRERKPKEYRKNDLQSWNDGEKRNVADTTSKLQQGHESGECRNKRRENVQPEHGRADTIKSGAMGKDEYASDPKSVGCEGHGRGKQKHSRAARHSDELAINADGFGLWAESDGLGESEQLGKNSAANDWRNFPTQPPVRGRDDGLPTESLRQRIREDSLGVISEEEIDKILSSAATSFRNEQIKAYGNAIVPEVAYQIFQTIDLYELLYD